MKTVRMKVRQATLDDIFTPERKIIKNKVFFIKSIYTQKVERAYSTTGYFDDYELFNMVTYNMIYVQQLKKDVQVESSLRIEIYVYEPNPEHVRPDDVYFISNGLEVHRLARCFYNEIDKIAILERHENIYLQKHIKMIDAMELKQTA